MTYKLHDYQQNLVNKVRQAYIDGYKSPCVVAPCGAGKSIIISEIARLTTINKKRVLFLVHRRELIEQITNTFIQNDVNLKFVEFGMVQTIVRRLGKTEPPDLIITDESHHSLASSYRKIYEYFDEALRLGFTATPIRLNGVGLKDVCDILIQEIDTTWLIENGYLTDFKYYAPKLINETQLRLNNLSEFTSKSVDNALNNVIWGDVIKHYKKLANDTQAIVYCHNIEASNKIKKTFLEHDIITEHIDAKTPKLQRDEIIQKFRDKKIKVLTNVDIIGEGFDVPDCSTVILLRPTKSLSLHIQQSMRGMRYKIDKQAIIIDHVGNVNRHGLPNSEQVWRLDAKKSKKEAVIKIKQCINCFAVYKSEFTKCSECGFDPPIEHKVSTLEVEENAELEEITNITLSFKKPEDCRSVKDLHQLAKSKGYKPGWAFHQAKRLKFI